MRLHRYEAQKIPRIMEFTMEPWALWNSREFQGMYCNWFSIYEKKKNFSDRQQYTESIGGIYDENS